MDIISLSPRPWQHATPKPIKMALRTLSEEVDDIPFADLTVKCGDKTFEAHRAFICRKSKVLKAALVGHFKVNSPSHPIINKTHILRDQEAQTQEFTFTDDHPDIVERMLLYCYAEDYDDTPSEERLQKYHSLLVFPKKDETTSSRPARPRRPIPGSYPPLITATRATSRRRLTGPLDDPPPAEETTNTNPFLNRVRDSQKLMINALVYALADKYDLDPLKALARSKFEEVPSLEEVPVDFANVAREVYTSTPSGDRGLRDLVLTTCMAHMDDLFRNDDFNALLEEEAQLSRDLLRREVAKGQLHHMIQSSLIDDLEAQNRHMTMEVRRLTEHAEEVASEGFSWEKIVNKHSACRHCDAKFSCEFRQNETFMRCTRCLTRHF